MTDYTSLTPEWLTAHKIKFILSDLDGTLAPHNEQEEETFAAWYKSIEQVGVGLIIVSNNDHKRVDDFVVRHKIVGVGRCKKPNTKTIEEAFFYKGLHPDTTLFMGDQLFTDIWCANKLQVRSVLVDWIPGEEDLLLKIKRVAERYLLKGWNLK